MCQNDLEFQQEMGQVSFGFRPYVVPGPFGSKPQMIALSA
jgi:hypothetical protein